MRTAGCDIPYGAPSRPVGRIFLGDAERKGGMIAVSLVVALIVAVGVAALPSWDVASSCCDWVELVTAESAAIACQVSVSEQGNMSGAPRALPVP